MDKELAGHLSVQLSSADGTNACVFLSIAVADWIRQKGSRLQLSMNAAYIQTKIEGIIESVPRDINDVRDPSAKYIVEDALKILSEKGAVGFCHSNTIMATTKGPATREGREDLLSALLQPDKKTCPSNIHMPPFIYCCKR